MMDKNPSSTDEQNTDSRVKQLTYRLLLKLLHLLVTCVEVVYHVIQQLIQRFSRGPVTPPLPHICADGRQLEKRPDHLGVIVVEPHICWQTLADVILWSMAYGIRYVSVYDRNGHARAGAETHLKPMLARRRRALYGAAPATISFLDESAENGLATANGDAGGDADGLQVTVALLWEPDGVGDMVAAARRLCDEVAAGARAPDSIDRHMFGAELRAARRWPDPALALKLGPVRALLGYLPWQLRLTEVLDAPARRPLAYEDFWRLLLMYGGIQQRMGS